MTITATKILAVATQAPLEEGTGSERSEPVDRKRLLRWPRQVSPHAVLVLIATGGLFAIAHIGLGYWSVDDAGITYAYAIGLADHGSLSPLPESMPVEGYSNPLLFFLIVLLRLVGLFDPITTHNTIELVAFSVMGMLVFQLLRGHGSVKASLLGVGVFVGLELLTPATWLWYRSGLENVVVSLTLVAFVYIADRSSRTSAFNWAAVGVIGFLAALTRPEAPVYVAAFYAALVLFAKPSALSHRTNLLRIARATAVTLVLYAAFLTWRRLVYGLWLPNTYYAKLAGGPTLIKNFQDYLLGAVFPYGNSLALALSTVVLALVRRFKRLAGIIALLILASLVMPLVGGKDMMGEHRFATTFFAMTHVAAAVLIAGAVSWVGTGSEPFSRRVILVMAAIPLVVFVVEVRALATLQVNDVTTARVAELHGARRVEHQRRLGVINPVVIAPDAGGALLFGAMQHIDNGFLTDFHMAHMARDMSVITQHQIAERRADLADTNPSWPFDRHLVGPQFSFHRDTHMFARRDLVDVATTPGGVEPFYDQEGVRVYLSPENVLYAGPNGLVRVEVIVTWTGKAPAEGLTLHGRIEGAGDGDDSISLEPYSDLQGTPVSTMQRRALLLRAPAEPGRHAVILELWQLKESLIRPPEVRMEVLTADQTQRVVDAIATAPGASPELVMRRIGWLREHWISRMGMARWRRERAALLAADKARGSKAASLLASLARDARLAAFDAGVPPAIRAAEQRVIEQQLNTGACGAAGDDARRALCIGRRIDRLRRYGYFGVLRRVPSAQQELARIELLRDRLSPELEYVALVGLTLAMPENVDLQMALLQSRAALGTTFPDLD